MTPVRFVDPRWSRRSEDEVAEVLGENAIRELRSFAGLPGDYTPERRFGTAGKKLADPVRAQNREFSAGLQAQMSDYIPASRRNLEGSTTPDC